RASSPELVFVTAFDQHAIEAFEVNAVDYLLKPVEVGRLGQALEKARWRLAAHRTNSTAPSVNDQLEKIVKMMAERQIRREHVAIEVRERLVPPPPDEI